MNNSQSVMSRAQFLKLFLDLIDKGFMKSESDTDILNVNNKLAIAFNKVDISGLLND